MTPSILREFREGVFIYLKGLRWAKKNPFYLMLLFIPAVFALFVLGASWGFLFSYQKTLFEWLIFQKPEGYLMAALYYFLRAVSYLVSFIAGVLFFLLVSNVLAAPLYDYVSLKVEENLIGRKPEEPSLLESLRLIREELKKSLFIFIASTVLLLTPGLNLFSPVATAFFLGSSVYDYPLARRSWTFRKRLLFNIRHGASIIGLGMWLCIPLLQFLLMPLAVIGGTMLATEHLKQKSGISSP